MLYSVMESEQTLDRFQKAVIPEVGSTPEKGVVEPDFRTQLRDPKLTPTHRNTLERERDRSEWERECDERKQCEQTLRRQIEDLQAKLSKVTVDYASLKEAHCHVTASSSFCTFSSGFGGIILGVAQFINATWQLPVAFLGAGVMFVSVTNPFWMRFNRSQEHQHHITSNCLNADVR